MNQKDIELIENYLLERLSIGETEAMEARLENDQPFFELYTEHKIIHEGTIFNALKVAEQDLAALESKIADHSVSGAKQKTKFNFSRKTLWTIAACVGILIIGIVKFFDITTMTNQEIFISNFQPYQNITTNKRTSAGDTLNQLIINAFNKYDSKDYPEAISLFEKIIKENDNPDFLFFLGNAQLANGHTKLAISTFNTYLKHSQDFKPQVMWYLALSHLNLNEKSKACSLLHDKTNFDATYLAKADRLEAKICP